MTSEIQAPTNSNMIQNFSTLQGMQQAQTDPSSRLASVLPSLGYSVAMPQGLMQAKVSYACMGKGPPLGKMYAGCFVSMDTMSQWNTHDLGRVTADIGSIAIEPAHLEAIPIEAQRIEGAQIQGILVEAVHISAPRGIGEAPSLGHSMNFG